MTNESTMTIVQPDAPHNRRIARNVAQRSVVHMGNLLAAQLKKLATQDDAARRDAVISFETQGIILAWENAVQNLRSHDHEPTE